MFTIVTRVNPVFFRVCGPPSPSRLCRSCLRRFGSLRKNTPLDFWIIYGGHIGNFIEKWTSFTEKCVKFMKPSTKNCFWELASGASRARGAPGSGVSKCCSDPPSTRAGGQDDGSTQTPSNYFCVYLWVGWYKIFCSTFVSP